MGRPDPPSYYRELPQGELQFRYRGHDRSAFDVLWERHEDRFQRQADIWSGGDPHMAADAMQDQWVKLNDAGVQDRYDPNLPWCPWASWILHNIIMDYHRRRAEGADEAHAADPSDKLQPPRPRKRKRIQGEPQGGMDVFRDPSPGPDEIVEHKDLLRTLEECLARLSREEYHLLYCRYTLGMVLREIAAIIGVQKPSAVHQRLDKVLETLRQCLERRTLSGDNP